MKQRPRVAIVVGNPKPRSRTRGVAEAVADKVCTAIDGMLGPVVDLADYAGRLFDVADAELQTITADVAASQVIVVASSTYKATYTGLLKAFFDRYGADGLRGSVAVPVMVGASAVHALAPEVFLRPLLVELGASVPTRSLYVIESQLAELDMVVTAWTALAAPLLASVVSVDSPRSD